MNSDDLSYYRKRFRQENLAARNAACPQARDRHEEMAAAYRLRCGLVMVTPVGDQSEAEGLVIRGLVEPA